MLNELKNGSRVGFELTVHHFQRDAKDELCQDVESEMCLVGMDEHVGQVPPDLESSGRMKDEGGAGGQVDTWGLFDGQAVVDEEGHLK